MFILVKPVFNHLIWKNSWIYSVIALTELSTWQLFASLILCCQVCEEKKCYKFENPSKQILLLAFVIQYLNINVCMYFSFKQRKKLEPLGAFNRQEVFSHYLNNLNKTYTVCFRRKVTPSTDICRPSFDNRFQG